MLNLIDFLVAVGPSPTERAKKSRWKFLKQYPTHLRDVINLFLSRVWGTFFKIKSISQRSEWFFNMSFYVVENHLYKKWVFWEAHKKPDRLFQAHAKLALINSIEYDYERTSHRLEINTFVLRCKTHKKGLKIPELVPYLWTCQLNVYSREPCLKIDFNANVRQLNTNTHS